jgi:hypothetical protein
MAHHARRCEVMIFGPDEPGIPAVAAGNPAKH